MKSLKNNSLKHCVLWAGLRKLKELENPEEPDGFINSDGRLS